MRLSHLVADLPIAPPPGGFAAHDPEVTGVAHDSRRVEPGDLFVALSGERFDGRAFVPTAAGAGAVAVLASEPPSGDAPGPAGLPWLTTEEPRPLLGPLAARVYGHPDRELDLIGVTGTNGKSTVASLVAALCDAAGRPAGLLGTLGYGFRDLEFPGARTTPEAPDLFRMLRRMKDAGAEAVAMEVSSHALAQHRTAAAGFDVAVFTNLTRDHLDYHRDFEDYFAAKRKLFDQLSPEGWVVTNADDAHGRRLAAELGANPGVAGRCLTYGMGGGDVFFLEAELDRSGARGVLATPRGPLSFATPLLGRYNLANLLAAVAAAEALALPHEAVARGLASFRPLSGRMEPVESGQNFPVLVDYAHTDAALRAALTSLREFWGGKVAVVFGCGGDRDRGKRPMMGRAAGELADRVYATSDNPRSEDPLAILAQVEEGLTASGNRDYRVIPDRRDAIRAALAEAAAEPGAWAVMVAGKGHEDTQTIGGEVRHFSDREEIAAALEASETAGAAAGGGAP